MSVISGVNESLSNLVFELDANNVKSISPNRLYAYGNTGFGSVSDNNVTFLIQGTGTFRRLGYGQTFGGYTILESDIVYKYDLGVSGCHYHGNTIYVPQGSYVAYKFDYYISPDAENYGVSPNNLFLSNAENNGAGIGTEFSAPNSNKGVWQTASGTFGPATASGNINFYLYPGACTSGVSGYIARLANSGYILYKNPQVEIVTSSTATVSSTFTYNKTTLSFKDVYTSGINANPYGTIPYEIDTVPCFNFSGITSTIGSGNVAPGAVSGFTFTNPVPTNSDFTISTWIKNPNSVGGQIGLFANAGAADGYRFGISTSSIYYLIGSTTTYKESYINFLSTLSASLWYNVVAIYDKTNSLIKLYLNGVYQGSDSIPNLVNYPFTSYDTGIVRSGCCSLYTGKLANLSIYNTALSESTILANFTANRSRYGV